MVQLCKLGHCGCDAQAENPRDTVVLFYLFDCSFWHSGHTNETKHCDQALPPTHSVLCPLRNLSLILFFCRFVSMLSLLLVCNWHRWISLRFETTPQSAQTCSKETKQTRPGTPHTHTLPPTNSEFKISKKIAGGQSARCCLVSQS